MDLTAPAAENLTSKAVGDGGVWHCLYFKPGTGQRSEAASQQRSPQAECGRR